jgi:4-amino-4-deoxy-L-arabinose transferase-like glycosyltransferase
MSATARDVRRGEATIGEAAHPRLTHLDALRTIAAALVVLSLAVLWVALTRQWIGPRPLNYDEAIFLDVARHIVDTGAPLRQISGPGPAVGFFDHTPLIVYLTAAVMAFGGDTLTIVRAIDWLAGLGTVWLVFLIVRGWQGLLAATLVASSFLFGYFAWLIHMEVPMAFAMVLAVWFLQRERMLAAALAAGVAVMFKEFALLFVAVLAVYALTRHGRRAAILFIAPSAIGFLGWLAYVAWLDWPQLLVTLGRWTRSAAVDSEGRFDGPPWDWLALMFRQLGVGPFILGAAGLVAAAVRRRIDPLALACAWYAIAAVAASVVLTEKTPQWWLGAVPLAAIAGGLMLRLADAHDGEVVRTETGV